MLSSNRSKDLFHLQSERNSPAPFSPGLPLVPGRRGHPPTAPSAPACGSGHTPAPVPGRAASEMAVGAPAAGFIIAASVAALQQMVLSLRAGRRPGLLSLSVSRPRRPGRDGPAAAGQPARLELLPAAAASPAQSPPYPHPPSFASGPGHPSLSISLQRRAGRSGPGGPCLGRGDRATRGAPSPRREPAVGGEGRDRRRGDGLRLNSEE